MCEQKQDTVYSTEHLSTPVLQLVTMDTTTFQQLYTQGPAICTVQIRDFAH